MRQRIIDLRNDETTAAHIAEALRLQTLYGYEYASDHLQTVGVQPQLAQRLLAIRYDRRAPGAGMHGSQPHSQAAASAA
ncbi:MAG: hypothetical protein V4484_00720 [Pseudomonadota bacterium]